MGEVHIREFEFQSSGVALQAVEGPASGPPLLLLHGLFDRWQTLEPIIEKFRGRWRVGGLDMRGHGRSGRARGRYLPEHYFRDTAEYLCARFDEPVAIFGHSAGGLAALWCAAEYPGRVRAVINGDLFCSSERLAALIRHPRSVAFYREAKTLASQPIERILTSELANSIPEAGRTTWAEALNQLDPETMSYHARGAGDAYVESVDVGGILTRISCPVLLLSGDPAYGGIMNDEDVAVACSRLRDACHVRLKGVGHNLGLFSGAADPLLRAMGEFLQAL